MGRIGVSGYVGLQISVVAVINYLKKSFCCYGCLSWENINIGIHLI
jgi:hypothetical protein